jgi:genome maintenance protein MGM101
MDTRSIRLVVSDSLERHKKGKHMNQDQEPIAAELTVAEYNDRSTQEQLAAVKVEKSPLTPAQARVDSVADVLAKARAQASLLKLTPEEVKLLKTEFPDEAFKMGAGGDPNLIYIEHAFLRDRFDEAIGMCQWSLIRSRPHWAEEYQTAKGQKAVRIYADCALVIRGCLVAEAIGEMSYYPNNGTQNYGDAVEGSETAAFRRCAKKIGVGLQAWKKDFGEGWKQRKHGSRSQPPRQQEFPKATTKPHQSQPGGSAQSSPGLQSDDRAPVQFDEGKFRDAAEAWLDTERTAWIKANTTPAAWTWAVCAGLILPNEKLDAVNTSALFPLSEQIEDIAGRIKTGKIAEAGGKRALRVSLLELTDKIAKLIDATGVGEEEQKAFDKIYRSTTQVAATAADEWFWQIIVPIPNAGQKRAEYEKDPDTIEGLYKAAKSGDDNARKRLFGFANRWKPESRKVGERTYDPSPADIKFREALDAFLAWEEAKAKTGCAEAKAATEEPPF